MGGFVCGGADHLSVHEQIDVALFEQSLLFRQRGRNDGKGESGSGKNFREAGHWGVSLEALFGAIECRGVIGDDARTLRAAVIAG
jgi:hypothetical protein